jgi:UrcA family protein
MNTPRDPRAIARFTGRALAALALSAACLALPVGPALAGTTNARMPAVTVQYAPARLEQAGYAGELYARLEDAAGQVCNEAATIAEKVLPRGDRMVSVNRRQFYFDHCMEKSLQRAIADVASPTLGALHERLRKGTVRIAARR